MCPAVVSFDGCGLSALAACAKNRPRAVGRGGGFHCAFVIPSAHLCLRTAVGRNSALVNDDGVDAQIRAGLAVGDKDDLIIDRGSRGLVGADAVLLGDLVSHAGVG